MDWKLFICVWSKIRNWFNSCLIFLFSNASFWRQMRWKKVRFLGRTLRVDSAPWLSVDRVVIKDKGWKPFKAGLALPIKSNWHSRASSSDQSTFTKLGPKMDFDQLLLKIFKSFSSKISWHPLMYNKSLLYLIEEQCLKAKLLKP